MRSLLPATICNTSPTLADELQKALSAWRVKAELQWCSMQVFAKRGESPGEGLVTIVLEIVFFNSCNEPIIMYNV